MNPAATHPASVAPVSRPLHEFFAEVEWPARVVWQSYPFEQPNGELVVNKPSTCTKLSIAELINSHAVPFMYLERGIPPWRLTDTMAPCAKAWSQWRNAPCAGINVRRPIIHETEYELEEQLASHLNTVFRTFSDLPLGGLVSDDAALRFNVEYGSHKARSDPIVVKLLNKKKHTTVGIVCQIEVKTEPVLSRHKDAIEALIDAGSPGLPQVLVAKQTGFSDAQRILLQMYNQLIEHKNTCGILLGDNIVYLFQLDIQRGTGGTSKNVGTLIVEGPLYMYPEGKQRPFTLAMMYDFIGWSTSNLLYRKRVEPRPPSPLLMLQGYWRNAIAANPFSRFSWTRGLMRLFAQWQLANCTSVVVEIPAGFILEDCKRVGPALVLPPFTPVELFKATKVCASYLPALRLRTDYIAGRGGSSLTVRGVHLGVPFILKFDINDSNNASEEWDRLASLDVVRAGSGGMLPIPSYYGLFESSIGQFSLLSDNGIDLAQHYVDDAVVRPLIDAARRQLREYGVEPTDIASRNTVWDGERITVIDFVQPVDNEE